jgi:hypothetical protein
MSGTRSSGQQLAWGEMVTAAMSRLAYHLMEPEPDAVPVANDSDGLALCWVLNPEEWREVYEAAQTIVNLAPLMEHRLHEPAMAARPDTNTGSGTA